MDERQFSRYFKAIGDPSRLRILGLLAGKEITVNELVKILGTSQSTVSRHLSVLRSAGFVRDRREGQRVFYSLNKTAVSDCCAGLCIRLEIPAPPGPRKKRK